MAKFEMTEKWHLQMGISCHFEFPAIVTLKLVSKLTDKNRRMEFKWQNNSHSIWKKNVFPFGKGVNLAILTFAIIEKITSVCESNET